MAEEEKRPTMKTAEDLLEQCGGTKLVKKVLIANNGISAVKVLLLSSLSISFSQPSLFPIQFSSLCFLQAMRSMRKWLYKVLGNEKAISFVVLATPDDIKINAEVPSFFLSSFKSLLYSLLFSHLSPQISTSALEISSKKFPEEATITTMPMLI